MALIPAGWFTMGDTLDGETDAIPTNVYVSAFYMDTNLVSYSQWQTVYNWATDHGYGFDNVGSGKASNHPVQLVNWYDAVKWCNARSQQAGLTPVYYTTTGLTQVYTNGIPVILVMDGLANGYRLPTEAEWEKAARGGLSGQRFPWGNTISESQANYYGDTNNSYDLGPNGYNTNFDTGTLPYTSPVGYFAPNGYGLYDMAGNVWEWCWDWYGTPYGQPLTSDPSGPATGSYRVARGGEWGNIYIGGVYGGGSANDTRCAGRFYQNPAIASVFCGFRCARAQ
jgi:formylglycine-generating enzyme required for sulfatase activity